MKKVRILFVAAALMLGVGSAFAFTSFAPCDEAVGYSQPIDSPEFIITGQYGVNYTCNTQFPTEDCRYVKLPNGTFELCKGRFVPLP